MVCLISIVLSVGNLKKKYTFIQQIIILNSYDISHIALGATESTVNKTDTFPFCKGIMFYSIKKHTH